MWTALALQKAANNCVYSFHIADTVFFKRVSHLFESYYLEYGKNRKIKFGMLFYILDVVCRLLYILQPQGPIAKGSWCNTSESYHFIKEDKNIESLYKWNGNSDNMPQ